MQRMRCLTVLLVLLGAVLVGCEKKRYSGASVTKNKVVPIGMSGLSVSLPECSVIEKMGNWYTFTFPSNKITVRELGLTYIIGGQYSYKDSLTATALEYRRNLEGKILKQGTFTGGYWHFYIRLDVRYVEGLVEVDGQKCGFFKGYKTSEMDYETFMNFAEQTIEIIKSIE